MPRLRSQIERAGRKNDEGIESPETRLKTFIDKFEPGRRKLIRAVRSELRKSIPSANELVYDNYNFFVIGYSPSDRPSDAIVSIAAGASGVNLYFLQGADLPDPHKLLLGSGKRGRYVRLDSVSVLARPEIRALLMAAIAHSKSPFRDGVRGRLVIRSVSARQRPRRAPER
ncbi:MAG TPA: DUF1801 domain-containing protein [Gemmatimonadaceae bacterium]|nr:DUF1801 domain-containing protein [Gemmatimonadaceae bacterium]